MECQPMCVRQTLTPKTEPTKREILSGVGPFKQWSPSVACPTPLTPKLR